MHRFQNLYIDIDTLEISGMYPKTHFVINCIFKKKKKEKTVSWHVAIKIIKINFSGKGKMYHNRKFIVLTRQYRYIQVWYMKLIFKICKVWYSKSKCPLSQWQRV